MGSLDFNLIKLIFGIIVTIGFFTISALLVLFPSIEPNQAMIFMLGQMSVAFILVYRHVFQAKTTAK